MKKLMIIALAAVAVSAWSSSDSMAQDYQNSYRFGVGLGYGQNFSGQNRGLRRGFPVFGGTIGVLNRVEAPPYFAQFPPVYYNGITPRPYGISPYAAPPGIVPVEMTVPAPKPQAIQNPYFEQEVAPVSQPEKVEASINNKTTHVINPYLESFTKN